MPLHSYIPSPVDPYGFPELDSNADEFSAFVAAASAYTASNSLQPTGGVTPTLYGDGGSGLWTTASTYQYNAGSINDQGLIAFAPSNATSFYTLDTAAGTPSVFTRPEITFSGWSRWITTRWCPVTKKFFFIPDYESRYVAWHPPTDVWQVFTNAAAPTAMQSSRHALFANRADTGPVIVIFTTSNTQVRVITTSNNSVLTLPVYGAAGVSGLAGITRWCLGPNQTLYGCNATGIYALTFFPAGYFYNSLVVDYSSLPDKSATNLFGADSSGNSGLRLAANGKFYAVPAARVSTSGVFTDQLFWLEFNPSTLALTRHPLKGEPPNSMADQLGTARTVTGLNPNTSYTFLPPTLMPDGRFAVPMSYPASVIGKDTNGTTDYSWNTYSPFIWSPHIGGWQQTVSVSNPSNPWGSIPQQWGMHNPGPIGADGCFYPAPYRISLSGSNYVYPGRFSSPPDNLPPAKFYASHFLT